ncbi:DUF2891 family protein [Phycisphaeraceae bacterium D3-23]
MIDIHPLCPDFDCSTFDRYARLALDGVVREYPNQPGYRLASDVELVPPRAVHPAFYGCYDWHSAVHGHWLLVRLLRLGLLSTSVARDADRVLRDHLTPERLEVELAYLGRPYCGSFEWPYGWAWLLALHAEAGRWDVGVASALGPVADELARRVPLMLERMRAPQRTGQHGDTAFALQLMLEAGVGHGLGDTIRSAALRWYGDDVDYPWRYEEGPYDFHSPGLSVIGLIQRVMEAEPFDEWHRTFWPGLFEADINLVPFIEPVTCIDDSDGKLAHLHGLNLERARSLSAIAASMPVDSESRGIVWGIASQHASAGLAGVHSGDYAGEHWLATFATRLLLGADAAD